MKKALVGVVLFLTAFCFTAWSQDDDSGELGYWQLTYSNSMAGNSAFLSVSAADKDNLYVAGLHQHSALGATYGWKSTDGGYSWEPVYQLEISSSDPCDMLYLMTFIFDVKAIDKDTAMLVGLGVNEECIEEFEDPLCLFICMFDMVPKILYTTDGGDNWEQILLGDPGELRFKTPAVLYFIDNQIGFMGGYGMLYITYDGGLTWAKIEIPEHAKQEEAELSINGIFAFDHQRIFLATGDADPDESKDGETMDDIIHRVLFFRDPYYRLLAYETGSAPKGINGALYYTDDGGLTWNVLKSSPDEGFTQVYFVDEQHGWLLTAPAEYTGEYFRAYRTTDGGETWEEMHFPASVPGVSGDYMISWLHFFDENRGYAIGGGQGLMNYKSVILYTTDGGETWEVDPFTASSNYPLLRATFLGQKHGWAVGMNLSCAKYFGPNSIPIADAGPDQTVHVGDEVQLDGTGSYDPDGDELSYFWSQPEGPLAQLDDSTSPTPTFTATEVGELVFELVVSDGEAESEPDQVTITVVEEGGDDDSGDEEGNVAGCGCGF